MKKTRFAAINSTSKKSDRMRPKTLAELESEKKYRLYTNQVGVLNKMKDFLKQNHSTMQERVKRKFIVHI